MGYCGDMEAARKLDSYYTYADYCTWGDDERWELIDGAAYAMAPAPSRGHQTISGKLFRQIGDFLDGKPCEVFIAPFDVRLNAGGADDTVVQPDILVVCDESKLKNGAGVIGAPDLIIEVLSPSTERRDRVTKFDLYMRSGVREYWIVDPVSKTVAAHALRGGLGYITRAYDGKETAVPVEVLEGCTIDLGKVFGGI